MEDEDDILAGLGINPADMEGGEDQAMAAAGINPADATPENYADARTLTLPETTIEGRPEGGGSVRVADEPATVEVQRRKEWTTDESAVPESVGQQWQERGGDPRSAADRVRQYLSGADPEALGSGWENARRLGAGLAGGMLAGPAGAVAAASASDPDAAPVSIAGRDLPTLASMRRAQDEGGILGPLGALDVAFPATNTETPIEGDDLRRWGPLTGATAPVRWAHSLGMRAVGRDDLAGQERDFAQRVEEQDPTGVAVGEASTLGGLLGPIGGAETALGRIALSALAGGGVGALRGGAESDAETADGLLGDTMRGAAEEAAAYAAAGGAGELAAGALGRAASRLPIMRENLTRGELHTRGLWASRADEAARRFPGGREGLARELNRLGAPLRAEEIPRWASEQADVIGPRVRQAAQDLTDAGARIDMGANADVVEELAAAAQNRAGGPPVASSLRSQVVEPWRAQAAENPAGVSFNDAWDERQWLDDLVGDLPQQGLGRARGRLLEARQRLSGSMGEEAARVDPALAEQWTQANRDFAPIGLLGAFGNGAERLNTLGGGAGMISRAAGTARALYGDPMGLVEATAGPAIQQELRMRLPGMQVRALRGLIPLLERSGPALQRAARVLRGAQQRGPAAMAAANHYLTNTSPEYRRARDEAARMAAEETDR